VDAGACGKLVDMLAHKNVSVQTPALRAVGNIVTGTEAQTQAILVHNPFPALAMLLHSKKKAIVKEACWCLSNITAGTAAQVEAAVHSGIMPTLGAVLINGENEAKKEACWAISNATTGGSVDLTRVWIERETIEGLVDMLKYPESKIQLVALEALENILEAGETMTAPGSKIVLQVNPFAEWLAELEGCEMLETLQDSKNDKVYTTASHIIEKFFQDEQDECDAAENLAPNLVSLPTGQSHFGFGVGLNNSSNNSFAF